MIEGKAFKEIIKDWRKNHKYTQSDVSKLFGFSTNMYSIWERGLQIPSPKRYGEIAKITGYSLDDIVNACKVSVERKLAAKELKKYNLKHNPKILKTAVVQPVVVNIPKEEPMPMIEFDNLLVKYTKKLNEKEKLMSDWLAIKDKIESVKLELVQIRDEIRKNA